MMLHTKFLGNQSIGSSEEDVRRVFTIHGNQGHLGHVANIIFICLCFLLIKLTYKNWFKMAQWFLRKARLDFDM